MTCSNIIFTFRWGIKKVEYTFIKTNVVVWFIVWVLLYYMRYVIVWFEEGKLSWVEKSVFV